MDTSLNIVDLIENNPITRLSGIYQNKLLTKIKAKFTNNEQQMFVASFYCFLNYNQRTEFVIELDDVWKWIGFSNKAHSKNFLEKNFIINKDYKLLLTQPSEQSKHPRGGHNKNIIMLNIDTFKKFCLKAGTKKADQIHEYYIKLEETLQEVIQEESNELKQQLEIKNNELNNQIITNDKDKEKIREKTLLEQFPNNTQCVYYGIIDNVSNNNEKLIKFGNSNNLKNRVLKHRKTYLNFRLVNVFKVENKIHIENSIKEHVLFIERQRTITLKNKKYVELLNIDGITFSDLDKTIKEIITSIEYSPENYIKILEHNKLLKTQLDDKNIVNNTHNFILLTAENKQLKIDNIKLINRYNTLKLKTNTIDQENPIQDLSHSANASEVPPNHIPHITPEEINNYGIVIHTCKNYTKKNKDGKYNIEGILYEKLYGTRQNVWDAIAYKTSGGLIKNDLIINRNGKIVSKKKCIYETMVDRFTKHGVNIQNPSANPSGVPSPQSASI